jgi:hypothetical protein
MKIISLLIISIFVISACSIGTKESSQIQSLQAQITELQRENANLREENILLKAGGTPQSVNVSDSSIFPAGTTFEESNNQECLKKAYDHFIMEGNARCIQAGYSTGQIGSGACKLTEKTIDELNTLRKNEESTCSSLYQ